MVWPPTTNVRTYYQDVHVNGCRTMINLDRCKPISRQLNVDRSVSLLLFPSHLAPPPHHSQPTIITILLSSFYLQPDLTLVVEFKKISFFRECLIQGSGSLDVLMSPPFFLSSGATTTSLPTNYHHYSPLLILLIA